MKLKSIFLPVLLFLFFLVHYHAKAQAPGWLWAKATGGAMLDVCQSVAVDYGSKDVYATGWFQGTTDFDPGPGTFNLTSVAGTDIFISKTDSSGNFVWAKAIGGAIDDYSFSIAIDGVGNGAIYTTGYFGSTVDFDPDVSGTFNLTCNPGVAIFILKLDSSGNFVWAKAMGGHYSWANSITVDPSGSGNIYTTGVFYETVDFDPGPGVFNLTSAGTSGEDIFVSKLNSSGDFVWAKAMGGSTPSSTSQDIGRSIAIDPSGSGDIYITGAFKGTSDFDPDTAVIFNLTSAGDFNGFISKLDSSGNFAWAKALRGKGDVDSYSIAVDPAGNGGIYTTGYFTDTADFKPGPGTFNLTSAGGTDIFICKLSAAGNFLWAKAMGGTLDDACTSIVVDHTGNGAIYTTGYFSGTADLDPDSSGTFNITSAGAYDVFISKSAGSGNFSWTKTMGGSNYDAGTSLSPDGSGKIYLGGYFQSPSISFDSFTLTNTGTNSFSDMFISCLDNSATGIESILFTHDISVFPNPAANEFTISDPAGRISEINMYDALGQNVLLKLKTGNKQQTIVDISSLSTGIYFLQITAADFLETKKLTVVSK